MNTLMEKALSTKIAYMGTPEISSKVLEGLLSAGYSIVGVITNPDKEVGRKRVLTPSPVKQVALAHGIPVFQPRKIREDYSFLQELKPDLILTMAYGQIVPQGVLDIPKLGCLNLHGSLLPALRGAAPIQRAIGNGDKVTGVTLMEMVAKMDAGKMFAKEEVTIDEEDNYSSLCDKISAAALTLSLRALPAYIAGELPGEEQDESLVTFANKILSEEEHLDLGLDSAPFLRNVRMLSLIPGGYLFLEGKKFKILGAKILDAVCNAPLGTLSIENKKLLLQLSDGRIEITLLQEEGKKMMPSRDFLNGNRSIGGKILQ